MKIWLLQWKRSVTRGHPGARLTSRLLSCQGISKEGRPCPPSFLFQRLYLGCQCLALHRVVCAQPLIFRSLRQENVAPCWYWQDTWRGSIATNRIAGSPFVEHQFLIQRCRMTWSQGFHKNMHAIVFLVPSPYQRIFTEHTTLANVYR